MIQFATRLTATGTHMPDGITQFYITFTDREHQLPGHISRITDCNFPVRMLYCNMYRLLYILDLRFVLFLRTVQLRFDSS